MRRKQHKLKTIGDFIDAIFDGDKPAQGFLIEQDRDIAEKSGKPALRIKSITRAGAKKKATRGAA